MIKIAVIGTGLIVFANTLLAQVGLSDLGKFVDAGLTIGTLWLIVRYLMKRDEKRSEQHKEIIKDLGKNHVEVLQKMVDQNEKEKEYLRSIINKKDERLGKR